MHPAHLQSPQANHSANRLRSIYGRSNSCYRGDPPPGAKNRLRGPGQ
jgi:hypothetical protein